jgi:molybdenum cofactor synthesis domain-containing protein
MPTPRKNPPPPTVHLVAVGNELLNAETRDTNLAWLIRRIAHRGGRVVRAAIIPDDFTSISQEIALARKRKVDLLVTTGGLGPTDDDATLAAIAEALGLSLLCDKKALAMVKARIAALSKYRRGFPMRLTRERRRMAFLPSGAMPLLNPVGVAPGMLLEIGRLRILALPGVPAEMKGIVKETLKGFWRDFFRGVVFVRKNIALRGIPEAELAPFIRRAHKKDLEVYIKSRLKVVGRLKKTRDVPPPQRLPWLILLHFSVIAGSRSEGRERIERLIEFLVNDLKRRYRYPLHVETRPDKPGR